MAAEQWAGFTDEDIEKIKTSTPLNGSSSIEKVSKPLKIASFSDDISTESSYLPQHSENCDSSSDDFKRLQQFEGTWKINKNQCSSSNTAAYKCTCESYSDESCEASSNCDDKSFSEQDPHATGDVSELEIFEVRQRHIEAENARRRALINKAIQDKKKRTQAEASKLSQITVELNRLDGMLSNDVSILRNYIEKASLEFSRAEKRYLQAEKELIDAKFDLYEKMQRKEQLTEHLCAIIEQNENRKAVKLVELMKQLEMETIIEDFVTPDMQPILSKYCILNEETYHRCQTIKPLTSDMQNDQSKDSERKGSESIEDN